MANDDVGFWSRRASLRSILDNLRWTLPWVWAHARLPLLGILFIHVLLGLQPALLIHVTRNLVDGVVDAAGAGAAGFGKVVPWLVAFGGTLMLTSEVLWNVRDTLNLRLEQHLNHALGKRFLEKASRLPLVFYDVSASYDRLERARNPGWKVQRFLFAAMHVFQGCLVAVSVAGMFAPTSLWISLALLAVLVPQVRMEVRQSRMFMSFTYDETEEERRAGYVDRLITGRSEQKEMRVFALQGTLTERWRAMRAALRERLFAQRRRHVLGAVPVTAMRVAVSVGVAGVLAYLLRDRLLTPGRFVAQFQGVNDMLRAGGSLGFHSREIQARSIDVGYLREFLELPEEEDTRPAVPASGTAPGRRTCFPRPLRQGLSVEDVWFAYPAEAEGAPRTSEGRDILRGIRLRLEPGERVALVGPNGAGKSTLAKVLLGLYAPASGRVLADGVDYREIDRESLSGAVSAAFQDYCNFELTLAQSIGLGVLRSGRAGRNGDLWPDWLKPDVELIEAAARKSGASAIAGRLPQGYDTPVGHVLDGGMGLSGGEWQRIAVARAFTRDPDLLILDEPAAALDSMAEAELYRQFRDLLKRRSALLISHRLGSARMADRILVMQSGRIVEEGDHDTLVSGGGVYAEMWEEQAQWYR